MNRAPILVLNPHSLKPALLFMTHMLQAQAHLVDNSRYLVRLWPEVVSALSVGAVSAQARLPLAGAAAGSLASLALEHSSCAPLVEIE